MKYVRHDKLGFILWSVNSGIMHAAIGDLLKEQSHGEGEIISAGFVDMSKNLPVCFGYSSSLDIGFRQDDSKSLAEQLRLVTHEKDNIR